MSRAERIAVGLILGALFALLVFPESRALWLGSLRFGSSPLASSPVLVENLPKLPEPNDALTRWQWVETGLRMLGRRQKVEPKRLDQLIDVARKGAVSEPDNAYWPLAESVFLNAKGDRSKAIAQWREASRVQAWRDPQASALTQLAIDLGDRSWINVGALARRTHTASNRAVTQARDFVRRTGFYGEDLQLRYDTLRIGVAIREGARSIRAGEDGIRISELATFPPDVFGFQSPRRLIVARIDFQAYLNEDRDSIEAEFAERAFRANDGWEAMTSGPDEGERRDQVIRAAAIPSVLPAGLLGAGAVGGLLWLGGSLLRRRSEGVFSKLWPLVFSILAAIPWFIVGYALTGLAIAGCLASLVITPTRSRVEEEEPTGGAYRLLITLLGAVLLSTVALFFGGLSTPGIEIAEALEMPSEWTGFSLVTPGLATLTIGITLLLAPAMAFATRQPTSRLVAVVIRDLGRATASLALGLLVLGTAPMLVVERSVSQDLSRMLENEPAHLLSR